MNIPPKTLKQNVLQRNMRPSSAAQLNSAPETPETPAAPAEMNKQRIITKRELDAIIFETEDYMNKPASIDNAYEEPVKTRRIAEGKPVSIHFKNNEDSNIFDSTIAENKTDMDGNTTDTEIKQPAIRKTALTERHANSPMLNNSTESLPVLEAFQSFLEVERKKNRHQLAALSMFFIIVLSIITGAGMYMGLIFMKQIQKNVARDVVALETKLDSDLFRLENELKIAQQSNLTTRQQLDSILGKFETRAEELRLPVAAEQDSIAEATVKPDAISQDYMDRVDNFKQIISILEQENSAMKKDLEGIQNNWSTLAESRKTPTRPMIRTIAMSIVPAGNEKSFSWRMPLPYSNQRRINQE